MIIISDIVYRFDIFQTSLFGNWICFCIQAYERKLSCSVLTAGACSVPTAGANHCTAGANHCTAKEGQTYSARDKINTSIKITTETN